MNINQAVQELKEFNGGIVDTSSLIYMDRLSLLEHFSAVLSLCVLPQVVREYGTASLPETIHILEHHYEHCTDTSVLLAAQKNNLPVITEDKAIHMQAERKGLPHFNTLMVLLRLYLAGEFTRMGYLKLMTELKGFAYYSPQIYRFAEQVRCLCEQGDKKQYAIVLKQ